jgi:hypothetical protein
VNEPDVNLAPYAGTRLTFVPAEARETGQLELVSFVPGPAGMSSVQIDEDLTVSVDFAVPGRLCTIEAPLSALSRQPGTMLGRLLGEDRVSSVFEILASGRDRLVAVGAESQRRGDRLPIYQPSLRGLNPGGVSFGNVVSGLAVGADDHEHPLVRAAAFLISAADLYNPAIDEPAVADLYGRLLPVAPDHLRAWVERSAELLARDAAGDRLMDLLDDDGYRRLAEAVEDIVHEAGIDSDWAQTFSRAVPPRRGSNDEAHRSAAASLRAVETTVHPESLEPADELAPQHEDDDADQPHISLAEPGRLNIAFQRRPSGKWVRVLDRESLALMTLVPVAKEGRRYLAEAVIPSHTSVVSIEIETTDVPLLGPSSSLIDTMIGAIEAGRDATMLSARGDLSAAQRWSVCSALWRELGDDTRANIADAYASDAEQVERSWRVHDSVREMIEG